MNKQQLLIHFINETKKLNVAVIGETIIDEFIDVRYEGQSMKSTCPVLKLNGEKTVQAGGAAAIVNHLKQFVKNVDFITNNKNEIIKTRFVESFDKKRHIEINKFDTSNFKDQKINVADYDIVIVADFGHGFCDKLGITDGFYLMSQTNSNNFGFNRVSKWKKYSKKSVCLDLREASLQMNKKVNLDIDSCVFDLYNYELNTENLFITIGNKGVVYTDGKTIVRNNAFKSDIVDTIGAGDTFYTFSCLTSYLNIEPSLINYIPSLAASLSTTWLCNDQSVTPLKLKQYATRFL